MTNIETKNIIGNEVPRIYIKSIEYKSPLDESKNKKINTRIYYYILDDFENPRWVGNKFVSDNLRFEFTFNISNRIKQSYSETKDINFASIFQSYFNSNILNIPTAIISDRKYYIFYNHIDFHVSHSSNLELNDGRYDLSVKYISYASSLLNSEISTHNIVNNGNLSNQYLLYSNNDIFVDSSMKQGNFYYKKYNLRETLIRNDYNYLIKNYDLLDSNSILVNTDVPEKTRAGIPANIIDLSSDNSYLLLQKVTKSGYGNSKGIIIIDYERVLSDKLSFYNYYSNSQIKSIILNQLPYELSITRNLVHYNSKKISYNIKNKNHTKDGKIDKSKIVEINNLDGTQNKNYKVFAFNDFDLNKREYGDYFYTAELKIVDNIEKIIQENFVDKYEKSIRTLKSYQKDFNSKIIHSAYGFTDQTFYQEIFLQKYTTDEYSLLECIKNMSLLCNLIFNNKFETLFFSLLNPLTCNITNINDIIDFAESKLFPALIRFKSVILNKDKNEKPNSTYNLDFVLNSAENIIANSNKEIGIEFISTVPYDSIQEYEKNSQGILSLTNNALSARITREIEKFNVKQNNIVSDDFVLSTYSPTLIFVNNKKSYILTQPEMLLTDYSVIYRNFIGDYAGIKESFNNYQNVFSQLENSGILVKSLSQKVKRTNSLSNKDIIYDNNPSNETLEYISNTGVLDFYNNLHSVKIKEGMVNSLTNSYQYKNASDSTKKMGNIIANIDSGSAATIFFTNQLISNLSVYTDFSSSRNTNTLFTSINTDINSSEYKYKLCELSEATANSVIPKNDYQIYNRVFLVSNSTTLTGSNNSTLSSSIDNELLNRFYAFSELPEYSRTHTEEVPEKIESIDYVKKEKDSKTALLLKRL